MEYKYRTLKNYDRLYDDYDISGNNAVEAEYESMADVNPDYAGNPLIEALPFCMSQEELAMSNLHTIHVPTEKDLKTKPIERLLSSVSALDKLVIPMQWHYELQRELYWCMCRAYLNRKLTFDSASSGCPVTFRGNESVERYHIYSPTSEGNVGFSVLGLSGCGKSKAVELALSHIPQTIIHFSGTPQQFIQVPYLYVVLQKSNLAGLWNGLARSLDTALGNDISPVYYPMMKKLNRLNDKLEYAARLCTIFKVGVIIIDEIEFLKTAVRKDTFEDLLSFNNMTGVALAVVGTNESKKELFPTFQMCRRFGRDIDASEYCRNIEEYKNLIRQLSEFQWFSKEKGFSSKAIIDAMYKESGGTVGMTIAIFKEMNRQYLIRMRKGNEPEINEKFVDECAKSSSTKSHERIKGVIDVAQLLSDSYITDGTSNNELPSVQSSSTENQQTKAQRITAITDSIKDKYKLNEDVIRKTVSNIILADPDLSDGELEAEARKKLDDMKPAVRARPKKKSYYDINNAHEEIMKQVVKI